MSKFILNKALSEHHHFRTNGELFDYVNSEEFTQLFFQNQLDRPIYFNLKNGNEKRITTSYYIGVDWLIRNDLAIQIEPKIDTLSIKTDYLRMFLQALKHPGVSGHTSKLYDIKFDEPEIEIKNEDDFLTPLLIIRFVYLLKGLVKKGLRKDYITVEQNLSGKVKGKILVSKTIRKNHFQANKTNTYCLFQEYSVDCIENRVLKKAYNFCIRYTNQLQLKLNPEIINFINPAFEKVSSVVELTELKAVKIGGLYKEYNEVLKLAKFILKRFGHNINSISSKEKIKTPPFWIDMSILFELHVLGLLKDRFGDKLKYHFKNSGNELDFLLNSEDYKLVIDAKYKPKYIRGKNNDDIRQISGYARLKKVYEELEVSYPNSIDCLIVYPDQENGNKTLNDVNLKEKPIDAYEGVFKINIILPTQQQKNGSEDNLITNL